MFKSTSFQNFEGKREIANIKTGSCNEAIQELFLAKPNRFVKHAYALRDYQTKNNLWNKILSAKDFEQFDEVVYFRTLDLYANEKDISLITPVSIEEKMALIEIIQNRYAYFLDIPSLQDELATLNAKKLHKLLKLISKFDATSQVTREDLENFTSELFLIMKGPPVELLEYFTNNTTTLMNKRLYRIVQEELLIKGLNNVINQFPEKTRYSLKEKAKVHIGRITRNKLWRFASLPLDLPFINQVKISDDLLEKILFDGMEAHSEELIALFRQNHMIDNYERFRKVYRTIAFATAFTYFYNEQKEALAKKNEEKKQDFLEQFKKIAKLITANSDIKEMSVTDLKDEQFKRTLEKFKAKYNEAPTTAEYEEMHRKIYGE
jgi:hypothetical protein